MLSYHLYEKHFIALKRIWSGDGDSKRIRAEQVRLAGD
jgi:hypothetical protein